MCRRIGRRDQRIAVHEAEHGSIAIEVEMMPGGRMTLEHLLRLAAAQADDLVLTNRVFN